MANQAPVISYGGMTDQGLVRTDNQDFYGRFPEDNLDITTPKGQLFIVADGMGGHRGGREASTIAVKAVKESYFGDESDNIIESLERAFHNANRAIYDYSTVHPGYQNMGTTCTALVLQGGRGYIAHVGDSRAYKIGKGAIVQLTNDHSSVAEMQRRGMLTEEEARHHPERSILYRAMGIQKDVSVDILDPIEFASKDVFLLCTDGLHGLVEDEELMRIAQSVPPEDACNRLIGLANDRGGYDNVTVEIVKIEGSPSFLNQLFR